MRSQQPLTLDVVRRKGTLSPRKNSNGYTLEASEAGDSIPSVITVRLFKMTSAVGGQLGLSEFEEAGASGGEDWSLSLRELCICQPARVGVAACVAF